MKLDSVPQGPQRLRRGAALVTLAAAVAVSVAMPACKMQDETSAAPTASAAPLEAKPSVADGSSHVRMMRAPADGQVAQIVHTEQARQQREGRQLVVYEGATWCEPCQKFHHAVEHGDLDSAFPKLTLLEFDADHDGERLANAGYMSQYIPLIALPGSDGSASGKQIEGGIKGDGAVGHLVTKLKQLLGQ